MTHNTLTPNAILYKKEEKLLISNVGNDLIMMDVDNGNYITLNAVGSAIWAKLESPISFKDLILSLTDEYEIDAKQCELETTAYLKTMLQHQLVFIQ